LGSTLYRQVPVLVCHFCSHAILISESTSAGPCVDDSASTSSKRVGRKREEGRGKRSKVTRYTVIPNLMHLLLRCIQSKLV
jgi:hypothetical protein